MIVRQTKEKLTFKDLDPKQFFVLGDEYNHQLYMKILPIDVRPNEPIPAAVYNAILLRNEYIGQTNRYEFKLEHFGGDQPVKLVDVLEITVHVK